MLLAPGPCDSGRRPGRLCCGHQGRADGHEGGLRGGPRLARGHLPQRGLHPLKGLTTSTCSGVRVSCAARPRMGGSCAPVPLISGRRPSKTWGAAIARPHCLCYVALAQAILSFGRQDSTCNTMKQHPGGRNSMEQHLGGGHGGKEGQNSHSVVREADGMPRRRCWRPATCTMR